MLGESISIKAHRHHHQLAAASGSSGKNGAGGGVKQHGGIRGISVT